MTDRYPLPSRIRDALLGPMLPPPHPERLACIAETGEHKLEHIRAAGLEGPVDALDVHPAPALPAVPPRLDGPTLYGGPWFGHFGHMLAEGIHRLWALSAFPELNGARIAFQIEEGVDPSSTPWFADVIALTGLSSDRLVFVDRPMRFDELVVPRQGRALGGATLIDDYADLFPLAPIPACEPGQARRLYVSRARIIHAGSYLGESLVESMLAAAGFEIVHAEMMGTAPLVARLAQAEVLIFAEGSAIHNLELCGRLPGRIFVIGRRFGTKRRFGALLASICDQWRIFPAANDDIGLEWDAGADAPRRGRACGINDLGRLIAELGDFAGIDLPTPGLETIREAQRRDLLRYLLDPRSGGGDSDEQIGRALRAIQRSPSVAPLLESPSTSFPLSR